MPRALSVPLCVAILATTLGVIPVRAATRNWNAADGNWNSPFAWSPSGVPGAGDTVSIGPFGNGFPHTITYDYTGAAIIRWPAR